MPNGQEIIDLLSLNLYTYCVNNPIRYRDPSGYIIELSSDATEAQIKAYETAIAYLMNSPTFQALFQLLMDATEVFTITFNDIFDDYYDNRTRTISWDPTGGLILGDNRSVMSAALALAHEMGHGAQHLNGEYPAMYLTDDQKLILEEANLLIMKYLLVKNLVNTLEASTMILSGHTEQVIRLIGEL
jgi:hypothetical protein